MRKVLCLFVALSFCCCGFNAYAAKGFSAKEKKYIEDRKYEISMLKEEQKLLKSKYNERSVNVSKEAQLRKKDIREVRDERNRKLKDTCDGYKQKIASFKKEISILKKSKMKGSSDIAKAYNALINAKILTLELKMEKEKNKLKLCQNCIKENNERYKRRAKDVDKVKVDFVKKNTAISKAYSELREVDKSIKSEEYYLKEAMKKYSFSDVKNYYAKIIKLIKKKNRNIELLTIRRKTLFVELSDSLIRVKLVCI